MNRNAKSQSDWPLVTTGGHVKIGLHNIGSSIHGIGYGLLNPGLNSTIVKALCWNLISLNILIYTYA
jgi:hypothetical protein